MNIALEGTTGKTTIAFKGNIREGVARNIAVPPLENNVHLLDAYVRRALKTGAEARKTYGANLNVTNLQEFVDSRERNFEDLAPALKASARTTLGNLVPFVPGIQERSTAAQTRIANLTRTTLGKTI